MIMTFHVCSLSRFVNDSADILDNPDYEVKFGDLKYDKEDQFGFHELMTQTMGITFNKAGEYRVKCYSEIPPPYSYHMAGEKTVNILD